MKYTLTLLVGILIGTGVGFGAWLYQVQARLQKLEQLLSIERPPSIVPLSTLRYRSYYTRPYYVPYPQSEDTVAPEPPEEPEPEA